MATNGLSPRQSAILDFIRDHIDQKHYPPTMREIGKGVGISTTSLVEYHLIALEEKKLIKRDRGLSRGLRLTEEQQQRSGC